MVRVSHRDSTGAESVELAVVAPIAMLIVGALLYALLASAWHVGVAHASTVGVRYATIPTGAGYGAYPAPEDVEQHMDEASPFFSSDACTTAITGEMVDNAPVTVTIQCVFPNPLGSLVAALTKNDPESGPFASTMTITSSAHGRRE